MPRVGLYSTHGHTILGSAAVWNAMQVVQYLIETAGMPVDFASEFGQTPLMDAACHGNFEIASYLVQRGANKMKTNLYRIAFMRNAVFPAFVLCL